MVGYDGAWRKEEILLKKILNQLREPRGVRDSVSKFSSAPLSGVPEVKGLGAEGKNVLKDANAEEGRFETESKNEIHDQDKAEERSSEWVDIGLNVSSNVQGSDKMNRQTTISLPRADRNGLNPFSPVTTNQKNRAEGRQLTRTNTAWVDTVSDLAVRAAETKRTKNVHMQGVYERLNEDLNNAQQEKKMQQREGGGAFDGEGEKRLDVLVEGAQTDNPTKVDVDPKVDVSAAHHEGASAGEENGSQDTRLMTPKSEDDGFPKEEENKKSE
eukprot:GDKK01026974.1.p1 GENE.GDKK01026974.1~~GDKK01026974.1.p1  ORF type:complete len:271 (-),score=65.84 GDKK01026974.1:236-1048(-)